MNVLNLRDFMAARTDMHSETNGINFTHVDQCFSSEVQFNHLLNVERKRTERSRKPFLLMLLDLAALRGISDRTETLEKIVKAVSMTVRDTDFRGWYKSGDVLGVILTEIHTINERVTDKIFFKLRDRVCCMLKPDLAGRIDVTFHVFPEEHDAKNISGRFNLKLYPDLAGSRRKSKIPFLIKRVIDIVGSLMALIVFSPLFLVISVSVKLTSEGPAFFKQERVGQWGRVFTFLKFRSMYVNGGHSPHLQYIQKFITEGQNGHAATDDEEQAVYKIQNDPRITPLGLFLRKTSLDELPQFFNVLMGDMSLVGPRPAIPYECDIYDIWHRQRLLQVKPGITGLWQVMGRSSTTFDEMVRLDLRYVSEWNIWLDLSILFKTPWVVLTGKGAY